MYRMAELDTAGAAKDEPRSDAVRMPRLTVRHLMLWALCTAVYLMAFKAVNYDLGRVYATFLAIQAPITGAELVGVIVLVYARVRGGSPMLRHPGHWLLLGEAIGAMAALASWSLDFRYPPLWFSSPLGLWFASPNHLIVGVIEQLPLVAWAIAFRRTKTLRWKLLFLGITAWGAWWILGWVQPAHNGQFWFSWFFWPHPLWESPLRGWAVVAVLLDLVHHQRRDWLHWTGVATYVAGALPELVIWL